MLVNLLHHTPLQVCAMAIRKSHGTEGKSDSTKHYLGEKDKELIFRVGRKYKHESVLEHISYSFDIDGISRACLQELARHRIASMTVRSTRYTLNKIPYVSLGVMDDPLNTYGNYLVLTGNYKIDMLSATQLNLLVDLMSDEKIDNDIAKYAIPESLKTSLVWTINARSLLNFFKLRNSKEALWEIRELAKAIYDELPDNHKFLYEDLFNGDSSKDE